MKIDKDKQEILRREYRDRMTIRAEEEIKEAEKEEEKK